MIGYFPKPYPDELFYSICARFQDRMQYPSKLAAIEDLFGSTTTMVAVDFPNNLDKLLTNLQPETYYTFEAIVNKHTLLPFYAPFLPSEQLQSLLRDMHEGGREGMYMRAGLTNGSIPLQQWLRFCLQCVNDDRATWGECYWHRIHQIPGVEICPYHKIGLQNSTAPARNHKKAYLFYTAEKTISNTLTYESEPFLPHQGVEVLLQIAFDANWLLNQLNIMSRLEFLQYQYKQLLFKSGMATYREKVRVRKLSPLFEDYYSPDLLKRLNCDREGYGKKNWQLRFFRKPYGMRQPVQHLLWIHFLGHTAETFFNLAVADKPFGSGPWPCLNPVCKYYHQPHIEKYNISHSYKWGAYGSPVGTFSCDCGFTYSRMGPDSSKEDQFRISIVRSYGYEWELALCQLWKDESTDLKTIAQRLCVDPSTVHRHAARLGLSFSIMNRSGTPKSYGIEWDQTLYQLWENEGMGLRAIARQLGADPATVMRHATRLGLTFSSSRRSRSTYSKAELHNIQEQRLNTQGMHRKLWMSAIDENPDTKLKILRDRFPQTYSWLYRNDAEWLRQCMMERRNHLRKSTKASIPKSSQTSNDILLATAVKEAARHLKSTQERPVRITATAILIHLDLGKQGAFQFALKKLPLTSLALKEVVESHEMFAVRRIWWTADLYRQEKRCPSRSEFTGRAGVRRWEATHIKEVINSALESLAISLKVEDQAL